jgi:hypothetical protein
VPIATPRLLWSEPLTVTPYFSGTDPANRRFLRHGIAKPSSRCRSSQKRCEFGLSGCVQLTFSSRSTDSPPKIRARPPGRALNSNE